MHSKQILSLGIDLAGSASRNTGLCLLNQDLYANVTTVRSDEEIIIIASGAKPDVVSIDAPLTLPRGRISLDIKGPPHLRECDKALRQMGIKFLPLTLGSMRMLTQRGMHLKQALENIGFQVIESYPGGAQDLLGFPRKQQGLTKLQSALSRYGVTGDIEKRQLDGDELDAITAALVGLLYLKSECMILGDKEEGTIILPKIHNISFAEADE